MLPFKLDQGKALLAWKCFTEKENAKQPVVERKRTLKCGKEQFFQTQNKAFKQTLTATGERLIKLYIRAYERAMATGFQPTAEEPYPVLFTNSVSLAKLCNASDRTMRNHIKKLKKVGFITRYVFHGRKHDFELCITPEIMLATEPTKVFELSPPTGLALAVLPECTDFPPNVARDTSGNIEREIGNVDKKGVAEPQPGMPDGDAASYTLATSISGHTGPQQGLIAAQNDPAEAMDATSLATGGGGAAEPEKVAVNATFVYFVKNFWQVAKEFIYPHMEFDQHQEKMAMRAIWSGVYCGFTEELTGQQWEMYHLQALERLHLAANYYRNNPTKYPPMPFSEWKDNCGYFDRGNAYGFQKTQDWYDKKLAWAHQTKVSDALRRAKLDFLKYEAGKAPKRLQEKSPLQLFRYHETKIRRLGSEALRKFYLQHSIPNN
ncbi:MAG: hypothetical protein ACO1OQ_12880 [Rufibacter sp.]